MLGHFAYFLSSAHFFFFFSKLLILDFFFKNIIRLSIGLDPDQAQQSNMKAISTKEGISQLLAPAEPQTLLQGKAFSEISYTCTGLDKHIF